MPKSESETDSLSGNSKYFNNVLSPKGSHNKTFCVYQDDNDDSFKIARSSCQYDNHVFVYGNKYKQHKVCGNC